MGNKPTMSFRASSEKQKAKWETAVEENNEYDSMSHLIRTSVERELANSGTPTVPTTDTNQNTGELVDSMEKVKYALEEQSEKLEKATEAMYESTSESDYTTEVFEHLPTTAEDAIEPPRIALQLSAPSPEISATLARLEHKTGVVKSVETDNTTRYYKEV